MIYITPFKNDELRTVTGPSSDSGFASIDEVIEMMGEPISRAPRYAIYGDDENRVIFSRDVRFDGA